ATWQVVSDETVSSALNKTDTRQGRKACTYEIPGQSSSFHLPCASKCELFAKSALATQETPVRMAKSHSNRGFNLCVRKDSNLLDFTTPESRLNALVKDFLELFLP